MFISKQLRILLLSLAVLLCTVTGCFKRVDNETSTIMITQQEMTAEDKITARAKEILAGMTTKEKISQMILVGVTARTKATQIKSWQPGGIVLFADSFDGSTKTKVKNRMTRFQKASKIKMIISVDEEGGTVTRISRFRSFRNSKFLSPRALYNNGGYTRVKSDTKAKDKLLKSLKINTNLAPVADVAYKKSNFIYARSFSTSAKKTSKYVKTVVKQMNKDKVVSVIKHFPGYGNNGDTHTSVIRDKRKLSTFKNRDLLPFKAGISQGCSMVMVNHNIVYAFDRKNPASLSKKVNRYLRNTMEYDGVIVTDSITMSGAAKFSGSAAKAAVKAVKAGNDMICADNSLPTIRSAIYKEVKKGTISRSQLNKSVLRILKMKLEKGIIK